MNAFRAAKVKDDESSIAFELWLRRIAAGRHTDDRNRDGSFARMQRLGSTNEGVSW